MADAGGKFILVKKADGTFERKSLDEIKKLKAQQSAPVQATPAVLSSTSTAVTVPAAIVAEPTQNQVSEVVQQSVAIAVESQAPKQQQSQQPQPQPQAFKQQPQKLAPTLTREDSKSLLEEELPAKGVGSPLISVPRDEQADQIIKQLSFAVQPNALNRLRTLIQLRMKDIRSVDQTKEALARPDTDGGIGLRPEQVKELMRLLPGEDMLIPFEAHLPSTTAPFNGFARAEKKNDTDKTPTQPKEVMVEAPPKPNAPVRMIPIQPVKQPTSTPTAADKQKVIDSFVKNNPEEPFFKLVNDYKPKPVMADITAKNMPVGPTDEIRYFSLTDFRRLSPKPEEAALRLKQKFLNMRNESVLLYLDALAAWKVSPLYNEYVSTVTDALAKKTRLGQDQDPKKITVPEMRALITMERQLDYF